MKQGIGTLVEMAKELERQNDAKRDFVADTRSIRMVAHEDQPPDGKSAPMPTLEIQNGSSESFKIGTHAHRQIGSRLTIPAKYYDRMLQEAPGLLARNVNHWFQEQPETRLVRTLDGTARALLSKRYRRLDNRVRGHGREGDRAAERSVDGHC